MAHLTSSRPCESRVCGRKSGATEPNPRSPPLMEEACPGAHEELGRSFARSAVGKKEIVTGDRFAKPPARDTNLIFVEAFSAGKMFVLWQRGRPATRASPIRPSRPPTTMPLTTVPGRYSRRPRRDDRDRGRTGRQAFSPALGTAPRPATGLNLRAAGVAPAAPTPDPTPSTEV